MANNKAFKVKNGLQAGRYLLSNGVETAGSVGYYLAGASYSSKSKDVSSQTTFPTGMTLSSDGTKMYVISSTGFECWQYTLSTAWDVSTATYAFKSFNFPQITTARSITFKPDGTKLYIAESYSTVDSIFAYNLSTAWDVSTATYGSENESVAAQDSEPLAVEFNADGTKMYVLGSSNDSVFQYSLSTAYNVSTSSYDSVSLSVSSQTTNPSGLRFNSDGTKMYVGSFQPDEIYQYSLSTAYDLSTASYDGVAFDFSAQEGTLYGFDWGDSGTKLYIVGVNNDTVYQYSTVAYTQTLDLSTGTTFAFTPSGATTVLFTNPPASGLAIGFTLEVINTGGYTLTWPSSVKWHGGTAPAVTYTKELYSFITTDGGTTYYGRRAAEDIQ